MKNRFFCSIKKLAAAGAALFVLLTVSCSNLVDMEHIKLAPKHSAKDSGMVTVYLSVAEKARSAFTTFDREEFTSFALECDGVLIEQWAFDAESGLSAYKMLTASGVELPVGEHTLVLSGTVNGGTTYADTVIQVIEDGTRISFELALANITREGSGTFAWNLTYPYSGKGIIEVDYSLYETEDGKTFSASGAKYSGYTSTINGTFSNSGRSVNSGLYIVQFTFYGGSNSDIVLGTWEDIVGIIKGKTTTLTDTLTSINKSYKVTYHLNGGKFNGNTSTTTVVQYYSSYKPVTLQTPAKANLDFAGWYENADFTGEPVTDWAARSRVGNIDLYAKWMYTVSFDSNGTEEAPAEGTIASVSAVEGKPVSLPKNTYTRDGYAFIKWNTLANPTDSASGLSAGNGSAFTASAHTTLYAQWEEKAEGSYAVTFVSNGGSIVETVIVADGETVPAPEITRSYYNFDGWYTSSDGGVTLSDAAFVFGDEGTAVTEDITLYAKWNPEVYTITYYDCDASLTDAAFTGEHEDGFAETHTYAEITALDSPEKDGCVFVGWYISSSGSGSPLTELSATGYTADIKLYAKWDRVVYHIGSSGTSSGTGAEDSQINSIANVVTKITAVNHPYDYTIIVHGTVYGTNTISLTAEKAASLTICGAESNETDKLNGSAGGSVLKLSTSVPVTLYDIAVTNGSASYGGGLNISGNTVLTLGNGALITTNKVVSPSDSSQGYGAGIYMSSGTVRMLEGSAIKNNTADQGNSRFGTPYGGGVYMYAGTFIMEGGEISGNKAKGNKTTNYGEGGGVYMTNGSTPTFIMTGGTISGNMSVNSDETAVYPYGGAVYKKAGTFKISGDAIIPYDDTSKNNVCCTGTNYITVAGELAADAPVATFYTDNTPGTKLLASDGITLTQDIADKFAVQFSTPDDFLYIKAVDGEGILSYPTYSITFRDENDEDFTGTLPEGAAVTHTYNTATTLPVPVRGGYEFLGWYITPDCFIRITTLDATSYTDDITVYAKWHEVESYNINYYDADSQSQTAAFTGVHEEGHAESHTYGTATVLDTPSRTGYVFAGWYTSSTASGSRVTTLGAYDYAYEINLYAKWTVINYELTFVTGRNDVSAPAKINYTVEDAVTLPNVSHIDYNFTGWYDAETGGTKVVSIEAGSTGNRTLYAYWTRKQYTVSFDSAGGSEVASLTIDSGTMATAPDNPSKDYYTFAGWWSTGNSAFNFDTVIRADVNLTAHWTPVVYTITYNGADGAVNTNPESYTVESDTITLADASKTGFTFDGWFDAETGGNKVTSIETGSSGNRTLYAHWTNAGVITVTVLPNATLSVTKTDEDDSFTLTALEGFTDYTWTFDGSSPASADGVTADGNVLTVDKSTLITGEAYIVEVTACKGSITYSARLTVKKAQ